MRRGLGVGIALILLSGLVSAVIAPAVWTARQVPPRWREGRWETTPDGAQARRLAEEQCGPFVGDAWVDYPDGAEAPLAQEATPEFAACFAEKVAPRFARDRLIE